MRRTFPPPDSDAWRQCDQLGISQVRALLRREDLAEPRPGWRSEAQRWLDARMARQGEYAFRGVLVAIALLGALILCLAWWRW